MTIELPKRTGILEWLWLFQEEKGEKKSLSFTVQFAQWNESGSMEQQCVLIQCNGGLASQLTSA